MSTSALLYLFFAFLVYFGLLAADGVVDWVVVDGVCSQPLVSSSRYTLEGGSV